MKTRELAALRGQIDEADRELVAALVKAVYQTIMDGAKKLEK